ncbi:phosphate ABC transporter ATP-binding protein [Phaeobacter sp. B1627]|uniref:phosphate ABC transporter ATP-binding protein n=1 Tax=Phaeobacter sp. B1627 TaxID=2583809 RepID=UPI001118AAE1|nr:ATP-binding cassette domain-containing protein [Phaeobacter sp. B1627]TNJ41134.1 ATP-binding cassette domain-containing protein [Phaeobacter sp. B1627]
MFHPLPFHQQMKASGPAEAPVMSLRDFSLSLDQRALLSGLTFDLFKGEVLGLIGRAGSGKTALLRAMCRLLDESRGIATSGALMFGQHDVYGRACDLPAVRRRVAFVPQRANPFPTSIWDNIAYGARLHRVAMDKPSMAELVETTLRRCLLWEALRDDLHRKRGTDLPIHQQRLLCIARSLAIQPHVLLLDRPTGSIDRMELELLNRLVDDLKTDHTLVLATSTLSETAQVADRVAYMEAGSIVEIDSAEMIFTAALNAGTRAFIDSIGM